MVYFNNRYISGGILFFLLWISYPGYSQLQNFASIRKIGQKDGLSSFNVKKILKDPKGFFWIATQDGLNNYDGKKIISYTKGSQGISLSNVDVWDLQIDPVNNHLWVLEYDALDCIDISTRKIKKRYQKNFFSKALKDVWLKQMVLVGEDIWIATSSETLILNTRTAKLEKFAQRINTKYAQAVNSLEIFYYENSNCLWLFSPYEGITTINPSTKKILKHYTFRNSDITIIRNNNNRAFYSVTKITDSNYLCGTNWGLLTIKSDGKGTLGFSNGYEGLRITESVKGVFYKNETVLIATFSGLFSISNKIRTSIIDPSQNIDGNWLENATSIAEEQGDIYLCSQKGLAIIHTNKSWLEKHEKSLDNIRFEHTYFQHPVNDSIIFVSTTNGFLKFNKKTLGIKRIKEGIPFYFSCLLEDSNLFVSSQDHLYIYKNDRLFSIEKIYAELEKISKESFNSAQKLSDSEYVMGSESQKGIYIWDKKNKTCTNLSTESHALKLPSDIVNYVFVNHTGEIIILSDHYISTVNLKRKTVSNIQIRNPINNEPLTFYFDIVEGKYFFAIGVYGYGVLITDKSFNVKKKYAVEEGLSNAGIYKLFNYRDSIIYATTNNGLACIDINNKKVSMVFESSGLQSNAFEEASGFIENNKFYAGGINGFTIIDPSRSLLNITPPSIYINRVFVESKKYIIDTTDLELQRLIIPNDVLQTTLYFSGINWKNPERTNFAWRVIELNKEWSNIGIQNFINLIGLEHGTYHFQVKAANEDGVWSEPKELVLKFLPKWYQTWWFKLLVFLTTGGIIYAFYRYRIRQIEKQHAIRKNIATDLHDDLGSTLNSVKVFTNLAISGVKQEESLQQVKDNLTEATMSLRDMIWVLDDSLDTVDELITRLKQFAIPVAGASNIEAIIKADSEVNNRQLTKEEKRNLFLICKEAINNSIKYAGASQIDVAITASGKKIQIIVADNGKGFNVDEVKKGYGLKNMQYRAGQIKYKVELNSIAGSGTSIIISPV